MTKTDRVVILLETLLEARAGDSSTIPSSERSRLLTNGSLWHSNCRAAYPDGDCLKPGRKCVSPYAELERALSQMKSERPSQFFHVMERYIRCQIVPRDIRTGFTIADGEKVPVFSRRLVTTWDARVRLKKAEEGVLWLAETMARVELPSEYRDAGDKRAA